MTLNIGIDLMVGAIPIVGDLFDVYWKANRKNVELLRRHFKANSLTERRLKRSDGLFVAGMIALIVATLRHFSTERGDFYRIGKVLALSFREFNLWCGQASTMERFVLHAHEAGVHDILYKNSLAVLEAAELLGIIKPTPEKPFDKTQFARTMAEKQFDVRNMHQKLQ